MQLGITADYAIRILLCLSSSKRVFSSKKLSQNLKISQQYIYRIGDVLKREKIVTTINGPAGGYLLLKDPKDISLYDVMSMFTTSMKINKCLEEGYCSRNAVPNCRVHQFYQELQEDIDAKLKAQTIATLSAGD